MQPRVQIARGSAFEVLLGAAAVADPHWRDVFESGTTTHDRVLATAGADFVDRVSAFGRFGWINLVGLLPSGTEAWQLEQLIEAVDAAPPDELHLLCLGGDRRQLVDAVGDQTLRDVVAGDPKAQQALAAALASDLLVVEVSPWLLATPSDVVRQTLLELLRAWRRDLLPSAAESDISEVLAADAASSSNRLAESSGRAFLDLIAPGLHYDPAGLDVVVAVPSSQVAPVVVVVDGRRQTVVLHPPLADPGVPPSQSGRLLELSRALGDRTRIQLLTLMQPGERTAVELARALHAPRTTLLHHLAILRAAGLIETTVTPGGAALYRLRPAGFRELADAAAHFVPRR